MSACGGGCKRPLAWSSIFIEKIEGSSTSTRYAPFLFAERKAVIPVAIFDLLPLTFSDLFSLLALSVLFSFLFFLLGRSLLLSLFCALGLPTHDIIARFALAVVGGRPAGRRWGHRC